MKARIGQVLYWAGCIISAFLVMVGLNSAFYANSDFDAEIANIRFTCTADELGLIS
jgi:hypothetical protein